MRALQHLLAMTVLASFIAGLPSAVEASEAPEISWPKDKWPVSNPEKEGIDPAAIGPSSSAPHGRRSP